MFPDSAHCSVFPSVPFQVYTLDTCICNDNRVKTISSDKPFVWMTQAWGLGCGEYSVTTRRKPRVPSDTLPLWQSAEGGRMNILNENKMISVMQKF